MYEMKKFGIFVSDQSKTKRRTLIEYQFDLRVRMGVLYVCPRLKYLSMIVLKTVQNLTHKKWNTFVSDIVINVIIWLLSYVYQGNWDMMIVGWQQLTGFESEESITCDVKVPTEQKNDSYINSGQKLRKRVPIGSFQREQLWWQCYVRCNT